MNLIEKYARNLDAIYENRTRGDYTFIGLLAEFARELRTEPIYSQATAVTNSKPHSRACGITKHEHGADCHTNCPTCHGKA